MTAPFLQHVSYDATWADLRVEEYTLTALKDIAAQFQAANSGVALFAGPSGTGKTMAASLMGKATGRDVFRVDLSLLVSKYIGETEKNLAALFEDNATSPAILLFDEADALFGKRTAVTDAHDRYANLDTHYLLQRIEDYPGLVILASNSRAAFDDAFLRRMRWVVTFAAPQPRPRLRWWQVVLKWFGLKVYS